MTPFHETAAQSRMGSPPPMVAAQPTDGEGRGRVVLTSASTRPSTRVRNIDPVGPGLRRAWAEHTGTMLGMIGGAGLYGTAALGMSVVNIHIALGVMLPLAALFAQLAVRSRRRADAVFARALAAEMADRGPDALAEAA